jgi:hypothetical protein
MEQGMAAMKTDGILKSYLSKCTCGEAVSRFSRVTRDQNMIALNEEQSLQEDHRKVGLRCDDALNNSKVAAMKYLCVEQITQFCTTQFLVKETTPVLLIVKLITILLYPVDVNSLKLSLEHACITCPLE